MTIRLLAATGMLGYGFLKESLDQALASGVDFIGSDCGSTDGGPHFLGSGRPGLPYNVVRRDLELLLQGTVGHGIPLILGSAGTAGGEPHLDWMRRMIHDIAKDKNLHFKLAVIHAEQSPSTVLSWLREDRITPLGPVPSLNEGVVQRAERIVAMMGVEPFMEALSKGADVILAGRSSDSALYASLPLLKGAPEGLAYHLAKLVECGGAIATPKLGQDCVLGVIEKDQVTVRPMDPRRRCTLARVSAHTLYENASASIIPEPGGYLNAASASYHQPDDRTVLIKGSEFVHTDPYTVKLEGAERIGFRTIVVAGLRDPVLVRDIDKYLESVSAIVARRMADQGVTGDDYQLNFTCYGRDGVLGPLEDETLRTTAHEIGLLVQAVAKTQEISESVASIAKTQVLHTSYEGQLAISGNAGFPFSPEIVPVGDAYQFSIWHLAAIDDPLAPFPIEYDRIKARRKPR